MIEWIFLKSNLILFFNFEIFVLYTFDIKIFFLYKILVIVVGDVVICDDFNWSMKFKNLKTTHLFTIGETKSKGEE